MRNLLLILCLGGSAALGSDHPGNLFLAGEDVRVSVPKTWTGWRVIDADGKEFATGAGESAEPGKLPVGYFEIREKDSPARISAGVLAKNAPVESTPIALDVAAAWFYPELQQIRDACTLSKLAGVRWVRDRASWPELEPSRGQFAGETRYEKALRIQHEMGLKVLQVNHICPPWAGQNAKKIPEDLRDVYLFYRDLARRWKGLADGIEPWNEPDIIEFGGQTGCEIASFQKAAYLGLKAGNPDLPVNQAVFATDRAETLDDYGGNEVYPYFDIYDLHHYVRLDEYPRAYGRHRAVSGGRPMWTTEFNLTVQWADEKTKEPSDDELRVQGYRVGKVFAEALHQGAEKAFYFILGHYVERDRQFGLVHPDFTPRPAYISFAAVGRLLNGAVPLGFVDFGNAKLKGYLFRTIVDGADRETLVCWSETTPVSVEVPAAERVFDYLGRETKANEKIELGRATQFVVLPPGGSKQLKLVPPPARAKRVEGKACPVVLQLIGPTDFKQSTFVRPESKELRLVAYNFSDAPAKGTLKLNGAGGVGGPSQIAAGTREEWMIRINDEAASMSATFDLPDGARALVSAKLSPH